MTSEWDIFEEATAGESPSLSDLSPIRVPHEKEKPFTETSPDLGLPDVSFEELLNLPHENLSTETTPDLDFSAIDIEELLKPSPLNKNLPSKQVPSFLRRDVPEPREPRKTRSTSSRVVISKPKSDIKSIDDVKEKPETPEKKSRKKRKPEPITRKKVDKERKRIVQKSSADVQQSETKNVNLKCSFPTGDSTEDNFPWTRVTAMNTAEKARFPPKSKELKDKTVIAFRPKWLGNNREEVRRNLECYLSNVTPKKKKALLFRPDKEPPWPSEDWKKNHPKATVRSLTFSELEKKDVEPHCTDSYLIVQSPLGFEPEELKISPRERKKLQDIDNIAEGVLKHNRDVISSSFIKKMEKLKKVPGETKEKGNYTQIANTSYKSGVTDVCTDLSKGEKLDFLQTLFPLSEKDSEEDTRAKFLDMCNKFGRYRGKGLSSKQKDELKEKNKLFFTLLAQQKAAYNWLRKRQQTVDTSKRKEIVFNKLLQCAEKARKVTMFQPTQASSNAKTVADMERTLKPFLGGEFSFLSAEDMKAIVPKVAVRIESIPPDKKVVYDFITKLPGKKIVIGSKAKINALQTDKQCAWINYHPTYPASKWQEIYLTRPCVILLVTYENIALGVNKIVIPKDTSITSIIDLNGYRYPDVRSNPFWRIVDTSSIPKSQVIPVFLVQANPLSEEDKQDRSAAQAEEEFLHQLKQTFKSSPESSSMSSSSSASEDLEDMDIDINEEDFES